MYGKYFVLFAILFTGWFLRKINFIDDKMNRSMNKLIVYFAYPCMIVHNIGSLDMSSRILAQFMTAFVISLVCFYIYGAITYGYSKLRRFPAEEANVLEFAMAAPNNGFMGFPVAVLFFGQTGLLMMLAHNAAMNFFIFTYGTRLMRRNFEGRRKATPKGIMKAVIKLLLNPNILALVIGFIISLCGGFIPDAVDEYLLYLGNVSTPMAMIFIGSTLTRCRFKDIIRSVATIEASLMKLIWLLNLQNSGNRVILNLGIFFPDQFILFLRGSRSQHLPLFQIQTLKNPQQMLIRFITTVNNLCETGAGLSPRIQLGIIHFLIAILTNQVFCCFRGEFPFLDLCKNLF